MSKEEQRIYFSSLYCEKNQENLILNLPYTLDLEGKWKCGIKDIYISFKSLNIPRFILITGDFCETSFIQKQEIPILQKIYLEKNQNYYSFSDPLYIPIKQQRIRRIEINLLDENFKQIYFNPELIIECLLHFHKDE